MMKETATLVAAVRSLAQLPSSQVESHGCQVMLTTGVAPEDGGRPATRRSENTPSARDQPEGGSLLVQVEQHIR